MEPAVPFAALGAAALLAVAAWAALAAAAVALRVTDVSRPYHVPLLLSSFSMTTYRGS